jgi:hypothetical protein
MVPESRLLNNRSEFRRVRRPAHGGIPRLHAAEPSKAAPLIPTPVTRINTGHPNQMEGDIMGMGKGLLLWMLGIPLPIIILLAIFWR